MCHKKIHTNIRDNKPDFLCSKHSKIHTLRKREKKEKNKITSVIFKYKKKIYICNRGILNLGNIIKKLLNE